MRLFDVEAKTRRVGTTTALVALDPDLCPTCGSDVAPITTRQPALLRHGGYGATMEVVTVHCVSESCRWYMQTQQTEVHPRQKTGDCSVDCLEACAYPGRFSECSL